MDRARRAKHDTGTRVLELADDGGLVRAIGRSDGLVLRNITEVIHAVARRGDRGLETEDVIIHPLKEAAGLLATPAMLADRHMQVGSRRGDVRLHDAAIHLLLGDRVAADRETIILLQQEGGRLRRLQADVIGRDNLWTGLILLAADQTKAKE